MGHYLKGKTYGQRIKVLVDLLKLYGRLNPNAATRSIQDMTVGLVAEIRQGHPDCAMQEVVR